MTQATACGIQLLTITIAQPLTYTHIAALVALAQSANNLQRMTALQELVVTKMFIHTLLERTAQKMPPHVLAQHLTTVGK